jgi:hypothetical protein
MPTTSSKFIVMCAAALLWAATGALAADRPGFFNFSFGKAKEEQKRAEQTSVQLKELDQRLYAFAGRYTTLIVWAADEIVQGNPAAEPRRLAHQIKLVGTSSIYDIVTGTDPFTKLMDCCWW